MTSSLAKIPKDILNNTFNFARYYSKNKDSILDMIRKNDKLINQFPTVSNDMLIASAIKNRNNVKLFASDEKMLDKYIRNVLIAGNYSDELIDITDIKHTLTVKDTKSHKICDTSNFQTFNQILNCLRDEPQYANAREFIMQKLLYYYPRALEQFPIAQFSGNPEKLVMDCLRRRPESVMYILHGKETHTELFKVMSRREFCMTAIQFFVEKYRVTKQYEKERFDDAFCDLFKFMPHDNDMSFCASALSLCGAVIKEIALQEDKLCRIALRQDPQALAYVDVQKDQLVNLALSLDGDVLAYVDNPTDSMVKLALKTKPHAIQYDLVQDEDNCLIALKSDPSVLEHLKNPTSHMMLIAVRQDGMLLKHCRKQSLRIVVEALKQNKSAEEFANKSILKTITEKYQ
jgi:hypothetical protein